MHNKSERLKIIRDYMKALLLALSDIHEYGIAHKDLKFDNFLFDPKTKKGVLIDFGVSEHVYIII